MGPLSFESGKVGSLIDLVVLTVGFNGATLIREWKGHYPLQLLRLFGASMGPLSFESGKRFLGNRYPCHSYCFNGATLIREWKGVADRCPVCHVEASMGPLSFESGKDIALLSLGALHLLQWGHSHSRVERNRRGNKRGRHSCFNGATLIREWKGRSIAESCRDRCRFNGATLIREWKGRLLSALAWDCQASMGPLSFESGKARRPGVL